MQSSRYAYDQLIAAQCPVNDSLLMIKAAHLNVLLPRIGTVSLLPTCAAVQLHCGGIPLRSLLRHKCLFVPPKEAPQKRQNTARCATAALETQRQGLPLSPSLSPSLFGQNVEAAQITSPVDPLRRKRSSASCFHIHVKDTAPDVSRLLHYCTRKC